MAKEKKGVRLEHISKIYQDPKTKKEFYAVHDTTLDIEPGTFVTLLGPSGCGKTTTLRMIAGFESPDEGEIYLGNEAINALTPNKRDTAMVFQSYALLPHYNVFDNVAYGLKIRKLPKEEIKKKVMDILELVELKGMESRMTNQLSGGQQQRVALARALVLEPGVLLFDEPLSNLDAKLRVTMRTEIRKIQQKVGITAVYVTHDQSEAMSISDKIIIMSKGKVEQIGTPRGGLYRRGQFSGGQGGGRKGGEGCDHGQRPAAGGQQFCGSETGRYRLFSDPPGGRGTVRGRTAGLQSHAVYVHGLLSVLSGKGGRCDGADHRL